MSFVIRWRLVACVTLGWLLIVALFGGLACLKYRDEWLAAQQQIGLEGIVGTWKHEKDNTSITLKVSAPMVVFSYPKLKYDKTEGSASGSGEASFRVLDAKTLEIGGGRETVTIDAITSEKLVLSGWGFNKTEFSKFGP
jgi:hypothetical protein